MKTLCCVLLLAGCVSAQIVNNATSTGGAVPAGEVVASDYAGADCGAKIAAALSAGSPVRVLVDNTCGNTLSAFTIPANYVVEFIRGTPATPTPYSQTGQIVVNGTLMGAPTAIGGAAGGISGVTVIKQADTTNLNPMIKLSGASSALLNISIDGNGTNNAASGPCVLIDDAPRSLLEGVQVRNCKTNGITIQSTTTSNASAVGKFIRVFSGLNGASGVACLRTSDVFVSNSEFSGNALHGINLSDCPGWRISQNDFDSNVYNGIYANGSGTGANSTGAIVTSNMFSNAQYDIILDGTNGGGVTGSWIIANNGFVAPATKTDNTYAGIWSHISYNNSILGNYFSAVAAHTYSYCVLADASSGVNHLSDNMCPVGAFTSAGYSLTAGDTNGLTNAASSLPAKQILTGNTWPDIVTTNCTIGDVATDAAYCPGGFLTAAQTATNDATKPIAAKAMKWVVTNGWTLAVSGTDMSDPSLAIAYADAASSLVRPEAPGSYISGVSHDAVTTGQYVLLYGTAGSNGQLTSSATCTPGYRYLGTWAQTAAAGTRTLHYNPGICPVQAATTDTFTNKTLDVEATGNVITTVSKIWLPAAACQNATATLLWDTPTSNPAVAACVTGTNTQKGVADFADSASLSMQQTLMLPADWTGAVGATFKWLTTATSGSVVWQIATICVADAETDDPAFNTASTVTDAAKGTTNQLNDATIASVTVTGCAAGELMHVKVFRDAADGSDDLAATARLIGVELTLRRAQ